MALNLFEVNWSVDDPETAVPELAYQAGCPATPALTVPEPLPDPPPTQAPLMAKQPAGRSIPPAAEPDDVAAVKFITPLMEKREPGVVDEIPTRLLLESI